MMLSAGIRRLLTLRNPNPLPCPATGVLHGVLTRTLKGAISKKAETGWLVLATCSLLTANRPSAIAHLYRFASTAANHYDALDILTGEAVPYAVNKAAIMREAALKSTVFVGVPRVILSLASLHASLQDPVKDSLSTIPRRSLSTENLNDTLTRGTALWSSIYSPYADKLKDKLGAYHPDLIAFIIQAYGSVLAPLPGYTKSFYDANEVDDNLNNQGNLSRAMVSVVGIACLRSEERVVPQLTSHVYGLLKARDPEHQSAEDAWLSSDEGVEWVLKTIDEILEAIETPQDDKSSTSTPANNAQMQ